MTVTNLPPVRRAVPIPRPRVLVRSWVAVLAIALMIAGDYRFSGGRSQDAALTGQADARAAVEVIVCGLVAAFLLFTVARPPRRERLPMVLVALWGFTMSMTLVAFWSPFPALAIARAVQLIIAAWLGHLIASAAETSHLWRLAHGYLALMLASIGMGLVLPYPPLEGNQGRFTWLLVHPNISGAFLALGATVAIASFLRRRAALADVAWPEWAYLATFGAISVALLATRSRGALAGGIAGVIAVLWSASRRRSRLDLALVGGSLFGLTWLLAGGNVIAFLERDNSTEKLSTLNSRTDVWRQAFELFGERPLFGRGFMSARGAFLDSFGLGGAHNAFVEVLVNSGAFGTFWWVLVLVLAVRAAARLGAERHPDGPVLFGVLICLIVGAFTDGGLGQASTAQNVWLVVVVGWLVVARRTSVSASAGRASIPVVDPAGGGTRVASPGFVRPSTSPGDERRPAGPTSTVGPWPPPPS